MKDTIIVLTSLCFVQLIFNLLKASKVQDQTLAIFVNLLRVFLSTLTALQIIFQSLKYSYSTLLILITTFTINAPKISLHKQTKSEQKVRKIQPSIITDVYSVCINIAAIIFIHEPSYQKFINFNNKLPHTINFLHLNDADKYSQQIYRINNFISYLSCLLDFILSTIPLLKNKRPNNMTSSIKTFLYLVAIFYILSDASDNSLLKQSPNESFIDGIFIFNMILDLLQFMMLAFPRKFLANLLTFINLGCGILGTFYSIYCQIYCKDIIIYIYTPLCVLIGQIADMFDGRAAEKFGGTKNGALYDDIADFTSFGIATGSYVFKILRRNCHCPLGLTLLVTTFYVFSILYRLIRFVIHKNAAGIKTGTKIFEGLPSPAGSAVILVYNLLIEICKLDQKIGYPYLLIIYITFIVLISLLTISYIQYPHFGRVILSSRKIPAAWKAIFISLFVLLVLRALILQKYTGLLIYLLIGSFTYMLSPLYFEKIGMYDDKLKEGEEYTDEGSRTY